MGWRSGGHPGSTAAGGSDVTRALAWLRDGADLVSLGRAFVSNPDLVARLRGSLPLAASEPEGCHQGGDRGYIDYPAHRR